MAVVRWIFGISLALVALLAPAPLAAQPGMAVPEKLRAINHIVVIVLENRSFDHLFGHFPGANGIADAGPAALQIRPDGVPYASLPQPIDLRAHPARPDMRFPATLPNGPYPIERFAPPDALLPSPVHAFYQEQAQINAGAMNRFVSETNVGGAVMGYHDMRVSHHWRLAQEFALADHFFHGAFGGSFLNHAWLVCSCAFRFPDAAASIVAQIDASGRVIKDGSVTPDGYAVNTLRSVHLHDPEDRKNPAILVPPQTMPHIGDRLDAANVSWKWYAGGYDDAMAGTPHSFFQFHHQPLAYFANLAPGTAAGKARLQDYNNLLRDIEANDLPRVAFYKPLGIHNMHPGYSSVTAGDTHLGDIVAKLRASPAYAHMLIIVTYDENGGFWDHVAPPRCDRWGPGTRVPMLAIGPMVKRGFVDHTPYDHGSILRTIALRFGAASVNDVDANAYPLTNMLR